MADEIQPDSAHALVCTWCSAPLESADLVRCPSCGASLIGDLAEPLPGVTAVDAAALIRGAPTAVRPRNRILSWISGDYPDDAQTATDAKALEPPDLAVRREMLRLELEGEVANLKAEADALVAEAAAEGRVVEPPAMNALSESGVAAAEAAVIGDDEATQAVAVADDGPAASAEGVAEVAEAAAAPAADGPTAQVVDAGEPIAEAEAAAEAADIAAAPAATAEPDAAPPA